MSTGHTNALSVSSAAQNVPLLPPGDGTFCAETASDVPESATSEPPREFCKTNPPSAPSSRPLSYVQLAAVRLIVQGYGSIAIARHLRLNRHTVGRWKRDPRFVAEVERLRERVAEMTLRQQQASAGAVSRPDDQRLSPAGMNRRATAQAASKKSDGGDDRGFDAMLAKVMRRIPGRGNA